MNHSKIFACIFFACQTIIANGQDQAYMNRESQWPKDGNGMTVIEVCWENPSGYSEEIQWVKEAIENTWENVANIEFQGWGKCGPNSKGVRIYIADDWPHCTGLGTHLDGKKNGMVLNFNPNSTIFPCVSYKKAECIKFVAAHEFGHALGLAHEQNRKDCICKEPGQGSDGGWYVTECDPNSIMNYCNPKWNNEGNLSDLDIKGIRIIYGAKNEVSGYSISLKDELGDDQIWENIYFELGSEEYLFHIDEKNPNDERSIRIPQDGYYEYSVMSKTIYKGNEKKFGSGSGRVYLTKGKEFKFVMSNLVGNHYNLEIVPD